MDQKKATKDESCDICRLVDTHPQNIAFTDPITGNPVSSEIFEDVCVVENTFPYLVYDGRKVIRHHLLVPKEHASTASALDPSSSAQFHALVDLLLDSGTYHVSFTRSTFSATTTIPGHLHTHLVILGEPVSRQIFDAQTGQNDVVFSS